MITVNIKVAITFDIDDNVGSDEIDDLLNNMDYNFHSDETEIVSTEILENQVN